MTSFRFMTDLVPRHTSSYFVAFCTGGGIIVMLGILYGVSVSFSSMTTDGAVAAFDLDAEGSIACWFSVVLLLFCGLTALLIRDIRTNLGLLDASNRRAWLFVSLVWFTMSLDEGASLHEGFKELLARLLGTRIIGDGSIYWVVPYFFILSVTGLFLLWTIRRTPSAVLCLVGVGLCYVIVVMAQLEWILRGLWPAQIIVEECAEMFGYLLILLTLGLYARESVSESAMVKRSVDSKPSSDRHSGFRWEAVESGLAS